MNKFLKNNIIKLEEMADEMGIDYYKMQYELVPIEIMLEVMSYGLPTRARHWKYGQSYEYQKMSGEMGMSKVYELVLNNDPSYAFLLDTNSDIINVMVSAHVLGHSHFFKNNFLFKKTDNKMVYKAAERARRIDDYIDKYGLKQVEEIMNIGFSMEKNIDWHKGINRKKYSGQSLVIKNKKKISTEFEDLIKVNKSFADFEIVNFPPSKEYDLLWFIINYSDIEDWKKDVLEIIRQESFYFYPQYMTKIMNEGFAVYTHVELMQRLDLSPHDFIEYSKLHERVVQPGTNKFNINPYYLGFKIFLDIEERWDKLYEKGESDITGFQKILQVVEEEDDISFVRNYLTKELCEEIQLFVYSRDNYNGDDILEIESRDLDDIKEYVVQDLYNYRAPIISVSNVSPFGVELEHESTNVGTLDLKHTKQVMTYLYKIWNTNIDLKTVDEDGIVYHITLDEEGFSI